jgi:DNA-binding NtrC family response regulator
MVDGKEMCDMPSVLLVGSPTPWRTHAADHLRASGFSLCLAGSRAQALRVVESADSVSCVIISAEGNEDAYLPLVRAMLSARQDLRILVLVDEVDIPRLVTFSQLGQRDGGTLLVEYVENRYDYVWLEHKVRQYLSQPVGRDRNPQPAFV